MKFRKDNSTESGADTLLTSSQEMRELAETLGLYRSAMKHVAEKQAAQPFGGKPAPVRTAWTRRVRMRLVLVPALAAAMAAAVIAPAVSHLHKTPAQAPAVQANAPDSTTDLAKVDDTVLMNQIDSDLSEDVPDALQPLADMDDQTTTAKAAGTKAGITTGSEKH
jgi:hypothetical protein